MPNQPTAKLLPLTLEQYAEERKLPASYLATVWGLKNVVHDGVACVEQPYTRMDGVVCAPRYRYANAEKRSPLNSGDRIVLYGQKQLISQEGDACILVEGESDTQTLCYARYNVLGIPGTSMWEKCVENDPKIVDFLAFKTVIVIQEPPSLKEKVKRLDSPAKMLTKIKASLPLSTVVAVRLWEFAPRDEEGEPLYKDVSGLWTYYGGLPGFRRFMDALHIAARAAVKRGGDNRQIHSMLASDVEMDLTRWLWYDRIPVGAVTVFAGMPGKGKSTAAVDVISRLTTGRDFPAAVKQVEACEVAILASEDNPKTTTVPRLKAADADVSKVHLIQGTSDGNQEWEIALDTDLGRMKAFLVAHPEIKLIVMDPVTSYIGDVDPNKPKEVRPFLNRLTEFAEEMDISLLLIMHLSKNPDVSALHRVGGAATWIEVPRSVWFFDVKKEDDSEEKPPSYVMMNGKLNLVADERKKSLEYAFAGVDVEIKGVLQSVGTIRWGGESSLTLEQQFDRKRNAKPGPEPKKTEAAKEWLQNFLCMGEKFASEVFAAGEAAGHKPDTLRDAQKRLAIKPEREFPNKGRWVWRLPVEQPDSDI